MDTDRELKLIELMIALSNLIQMWMIFINRQQIEKNTAITKQIRNGCVNCQENN